jgi:hypothetical protein
MSPGPIGPTPTRPPRPRPTQPTRPRIGMLPVAALASVLLALDKLPIGRSRGCNPGAPPGRALAVALSTGRVGGWPAGAEGSPPAASP